MLEIYKNFWKVEIQLKRGRKVHITGDDKSGRPHLRTLCGKPYAIDQRTHAKKGCDLAGNECPACVAVLQKWLDDDIAEFGRR
ncbi:MAG: hypothetical protein ABSG03_41305 [Bryobacteraceae bacterium]